MDLRTKLTLDGSDFTRGMNDAGKSVEDFTNASKMSASELLNQMKGMDKLGRSTGNYRSQLAQMQRQIQDLTINYRAMSDEMKNSDFGKAVAAKIDELTMKAGEYKDAIVDAQAAVRALSSDTAGWDAMRQGIDTVSSSLQAFAGMGVLGKKSTEQLVAVLTKMKAIEAGANAVIKIGNALQKQSALMMGIAKVQSLALAKAKAAEAAATGKATVAQKLFNIVANANPYVLLATAVITVVTALAVFARESSKAKQKEEEARKAAEKSAEAYKKWKDAMASSIGGVMGKFRQLQMQWSTLKTEAEKKDWIKDNAKEFENLGLKVESVNDAEEVLVSNSENVVKALIAKARAMAMLNLAADIEEDLIKAEIERDQKLEREAKMMKYVKPGGSTLDDRTRDYWDKAGLQKGTDYKVILEAEGDLIYERYQLEKSGLDKINAYREKVANEEVERLNEQKRLVQEKFEEYTNETENAAKKVKQMNNGGSTTSKTGTTETVKQEVKVEYEPRSYAEAQAKVQALQKELSNMSIDSTSYGLVKAALAAAKIEAEELKKAMEDAKEEAKPVAGSYAEAAAMVAMLKKELQSLDPSTADFKDVKFELESWEEELERISKLMETSKEKAEEMSGLELFSNSVGSIQSITSSISSIYDTWKSLDEEIGEADPFEAFLKGANAVLSTMQSIASAIEAINTIASIFNGLESGSLIIQKAKNKEKAKELALEAGLTGEKATNAMIDTTAAAAGAAKSASSIPVVGWILAIGAVAAIIAAIAAAKNSVHFAGGGIVPGASFSGDKIAAQLNSGEMVLNKQQQANLFNMLDKGVTGDSAGKVEFVIKGQDLKGVLDNYGKRMSRI